MKTMIIGQLILYYQRFKISSLIKLKRFKMIANKIKKRKNLKIKSRKT